jgi:hypothetical protein
MNEINTRISRLSKLCRKSGLCTAQHTCRTSDISTFMTEQEINCLAIRDTIKIKIYGTVTLLVVYMGVKLGLSDKGKTQAECVQERGAEQYIWD